MYRLEQIFLFLVLLTLPFTFSWQFWPQFSYIYDIPLGYLSPAIYLWDLLVLGLLGLSVANQKQVNRLALNLLFVFLLTQLVSLIPQLGVDLKVGPGLVRIEQYLIAGLFGLYLASSELVSNFLKFKWWWVVMGGYFLMATIVIPDLIGDPSNSWIPASVGMTFGEENSLVELAWQLFQAHQLLGVGLNSLIPTLADQLLIVPSRDIQPVGNAYLLILAETALVGALGFLCLLLYPIFKLFKSLTTNYSLLTTLLIWDLIFLLSLSSNFFLVAPAGYRLLFLVWGLSLGYNK